MKKSVNRILIWNSLWITIIIERKIKGKPERGRLRTPFMKHVMGDTGIVTYRELKKTIISTRKNG